MMWFIKNKIESIVLSFIKMKYPFVKWGEKIKIYGYPLLQFHKNADIYIGDHVILQSKAADNMVGLFKKCSIYVGANAKFCINNFSGMSGVSIYCVNNIYIGKFVNIGGNVCIWDTNFHPIYSEDRRVHNISKIKTAPIYIHDDVFIGANSIILKGVTIG
ncbi:MAG: hypothetical protein Q8903_07765, partial [Bacteroidota bacterium]|nr:hypothetical protein [Bacteroidota bacterium]